MPSKNTQIGISPASLQSDMLADNSFKSQREKLVKK